MYSSIFTSQASLYLFINPFATGSTSVFYWISVEKSWKVYHFHTCSIPQRRIFITILTVPRKHLFKIVWNFWRKRFTISRKCIFSLNVMYPAQITAWILSHTKMSECKELNEQHYVSWMGTELRIGSWNNVWIKEGCRKERVIKKRRERKYQGGQKDRGGGRNEASLI